MARPTFSFGGGSMRIALSYNAGRMTDKLTLQTALARVVSRGGILEASVVKADQRPLFARMMNAPMEDRSHKAPTVSVNLSSNHASPCYEHSGKALLNATLLASWLDRGRDILW